MSNVITATSTGERDPTNGRFLPGNSGFSGRPKGSRNRLTTEFLDDLHQTWSTHGKQALERCAIEEPAQFVRVVAGLLPREATLDVNVGIDITDYVARFRAAVEMLDGADPSQAIQMHRPKRIRVIDHDD